MHELVDVLTAGREVLVVVLDVLVVDDVLVVVDVLVVGGALVVLDVLVVAPLVVVLELRLVVSVVLVVLLVVVVVLVVVGAGTAGALVEAVAGSPRYTQDTSTVGAGQLAGHANFTGKSATETSGALTAQPF